MSPFSLQKKKHPEAPFTLAPASRLASSQVAQQLQFPTNSRSHLQSLHEKQQSQPVCAWSAHAPQLGQSPSPFSRSSFALSTSATDAGELFLIGGYVNRPWSLSNDLYVISTRNFSTTLVQTSGDGPRPCYGHRAVLTSTTLLIWGGTSDEYAQKPFNGNRFYLLNLGTSDVFHLKTTPADQSSCVPVSREWTRILVNGPRPGGRFDHTMTLFGTKLFVFGGQTGNGRLVNDIWALDLNCCTFSPRFPEPF
jgi:hypothetical protein